MNVEGYNTFLQTLVANNLVPADKARLAGAFLDTMAAAQQSRALSFPLTVKDDVVYVGFIRLMSLADMRPPAGGSVPPRQKIRSDGWERGAPQAPAPQMMPEPPPPQ
jgi:hypothetical protein